MEQTWGTGAGHSEAEMRTSGQVTVHVEAPPGAVYDLVADVTRIGEFSPECRRAEWLDDARRATPGARFRGRNIANKLSRWSRTCEVLTANGGREFSFRTVPAPTKPDSTVWCYRFQPAGDGTDVTESYEVVKLPPRPLLALYRHLLPHHMDMRPHLRRTLEAIKRTAEANAVGTADARDTYDSGNDNNSQTLRT
jgi:Polyketide cyclase / dehydrase and lipid transport